MTDPATRSLAQLDPAGPLDGNEVLPVVQAGATLRTTAAALAALAVAGVAPADPAGTAAALVADEAAARSAAIDAAIAALVDGAPGALDTLAELAAALANEADAVAALVAAVNARALNTDLAAETAARIAASAADRAALGLRTAGMSAGDTFRRSDRPIHLDVAPTGHVWRTDYPAVSGVYGPGRIAAGALVADAGKTSYNLLDLVKSPATVSVEFSFGPGTGIMAGMGMHVSTVGTSGLNAALNAVHMGCGPNTWAVLRGDGVAIPSIASGAFATPLVAGQRYQMTATHLGDRIVLVLPTADAGLGHNVVELTDPTLLTRWGRYLVAEHYQPAGSAATDRQPSFHRLSVSPPRPAPAGHHVTHETGGSDPLALGAGQITAGTIDVARLPASVTRVGSFARSGRLTPPPGTIGGTRSVNNTTCCLIPITLDEAETIAGLAIESTAAGGGVAREALYLCASTAGLPGIVLATATVDATSAPGIIEGTFAAPYAAAPGRYWLGVHSYPSGPYPTLRAFSASFQGPNLPYTAGTSGISCYLTDNIGTSPASTLAAATLTPANQGVIVSRRSA